MSKLMINQSLLSAFDWSFKKEDGYEDFLKSLRKEPIETNEAMQNGKDFEELVTRIAEGKPVDEKSKWLKPANTIADIVRGGQFQVRIYKDKQIDGIDFVIYGVLDVLKAGTIYDIKFSKNYEVGRYLDSVQHLLYLEIVPESDRFTYLVSDGSDVFIETYMRNEVEPIDRAIREFMQYLNKVGLMEVYKAHWKSLY